jgi:hypothetical protein
MPGWKIKITFEFLEKFKKDKDFRSNIFTEKIINARC